MRGFDIKTQEDVDAYYRRQGRTQPRATMETYAETQTAVDLMALPHALPRPGAALVEHVVKPGRKVSKTEQRYAGVLEVAQHDGQIKAWWHHPLKLWIAPAMSYEPDYVSQGGGLEVLPFLPSQPITLSPAWTAAVCHFRVFQLTCIEVKYSWMFDRRRALDRLKTAASLYPQLRFRLAVWDRQQQRFLEQEIPAL